MCVVHGLCRPFRTYEAQATIEDMLNFVSLSGDLLKFRLGQVGGKKKLVEKRLCTKQAPHAIKGACSF